MRKGTNESKLLRVCDGRRLDVVDLLDDDVRVTCGREERRKGEKGRRKWGRKSANR